MDQAVQNTDREVWRETPDDAYSPSIHVTADGMIGINVGGKVYVKPIQEWHLLAREHHGIYKKCPQCHRSELDDGTSLPLTRCRWCGNRYEGEEAS
jgi:hypothetical protein